MTIAIDRPTTRVNSVKKAEPVVVENPLPSRIAGTVPTMAPSAAAHLTPEQLEALAAELDAIRDEVLGGLGESDARYIHNVIKLQRSLEIAGRGALIFSLNPAAWIAGTAALSVAKILDNMEIGHNVLLGQWDWMKDP